MTMPSIYLSPSTQEYNPYVTGAGSEEYFMNLLADAMEPYLLANTIRFTRNTPDMTAASSIRQANSGSYDFYLALHSNASADGSREGTVRTQGSPLNLRAAPALNSAVVTTMPSGAPVTVYGRYQDWYTVGYNGLLGYAFAFADYIT